MGPLAAIGAGVNILGGILGMKKQKPLSAGTIIGQTAAGVEGQAKGAREAGEKYGFNPLTLLGLGGAGVGSMAASGPPLASFDMISGGLRSLEEERSGENEQRRVRAGFENDLLRLEIDRLKGGGSVRAGSSGVGSGSGRNIASGNKSVLPPLSINPDLGMTPSSITAGRDVQVMKTANTGGVFQMENNWTSGPLSILGDSEPWGLDEILGAVPQVVPQLAINYGKKIGQWAATSNSSPFQKDKYKSRESKPDGYIPGDTWFADKPYWKTKSGGMTTIMPGLKRAKPPLSVNIE